MKSKGIYLGLSLLFALFLCLSPSLSAGQKFTHIVKKSDTLWSICEQYYGDPYLWPELWEMNKFITNPHWLRPGDVIMLLEYKEKKSKPEKKIVKLQKKQPLKKLTSKKLMGVNISSLTNTKDLGFLIQETIEPWGRIFDFQIEKILVSKNDTVYVKMYKKDIKPGDKFTIFGISDPISHPSTEKKFGYIHIFKGILEIEKTQEDYYVAKISELFRSIQKKDLREDLHQADIMPYNPAPSCILLIPCKESTLTAHVWAAKDKLELLGQYSVVYIDAGHSMGVRKGNVFEAIEERESSFDEQKKESVALPPTILGKILILDTKENTSTGVVFWASKNFSTGVKVRPQVWHKQQEELSNLPACPIK